MNEYIKWPFVYATSPLEEFQIIKFLPDQTETPLWKPQNYFKKLIESRAKMKTRKLQLHTIKEFFFNQV